MKIMFDTNVLLDSILNRPGRDTALTLLQAVAEDKITGVVSASSITDIYYLSSKGIGDSGAREAVFDLLAILDVAPVDGEMCYAALGIPVDDYEDAVLAICASNEQADCIVSRDEKFLKSDSPVPVKRPQDVLSALTDSQ